MVEGRSWQSLKERFKRSIVKRLDLFGLDEQQEEQLRQGGRRRGEVKSSIRRDVPGSVRNRWHS